MMVAVTLVLIMMTMFAQVFQVAGGAISKQRGLAENDQRSRTLQTIIKADLDKRSFRWVYPFAANEDPTAPESYMTRRQGYFYISENNPYNSADDELQFTIVSTIRDRNKDETPYYGQALNYSDSTRFFGSPPASGDVFYFPNQPEVDDAQLTLNNTGISSVAEVSYFLRNGNLYRRQLLIRKPLSAAGSDPQPTDYDYRAPNRPKRDIFDPSSAAAFHYSSTGTFWRDFDYSAYFDPATGSAKFLGTDALDNGGSATSIAIAHPFRRFGHYHYDSTNVIYSGRPKEFGSNDNSQPGFLSYIGRFTLQECSDTDFRYPQTGTTSGVFPTSPAVNLTLDVNDASVDSPDNLGGGDRRGEDLLMPNVHSFDILVWDDAYGGFVNIGDPNLPSTVTNFRAPADYAIQRRQNNSYGPRLPAVEDIPNGIVNACFDTWHPQIDIDGASGTNDNPPFRPMHRLPGMGTWNDTTSYNPGDEVFPPTVEPGYPFFYRCIQGSTSTNSGAAQPTWQRAAGLTSLDGNGAIWQAVDNRKPLKAIKLEIRFVDPSTQQMRQLTIIQSLVD